MQYQLHFYALFFLGEFQARECFPLIMEMASFPTDILDYLIGDTVTEGLPQILYHTALSGPEAPAGSDMESGAGGG